MASENVQLWPLVADQIKTGGVAINAAYGPMRGGYITNPYTPTDQGIVVQEPIYVDITMPATLGLVTTSEAIQPGSTFSIPANFQGIVSVNAATTGHRIGGVIYQPSPAFAASTETFPPTGPTSLLKALPQYLYQQYADDQDLISFVNAFNQLVQEYMDWASSVSLPVYSGLSGALLDWVLTGLYGIERPSLPSGNSQNLGALNTVPLNTLPLNTQIIIGPPNYYLTSDDVYKRIATWYKYLGDGKTFNVRWLKRRVARFLTGTDGTGGTTDQTYGIGVTFGTDGQININLQSVRRSATGGALLNVAPLNGFGLNEFDTESVIIPVSPLVPIFKAAVAAGVLEFPFQLTPIVNT